MRMATCRSGARYNLSRLSFLGRPEPAARTDIRAPVWYTSREALHVGSRLPPPLPAHCRGDGLCAARSRNCRPAPCPCSDHAPSARARPATICQSMAATRCPGSFAGYSISRAPLLRRHQCLPLGSVRAGRSTVHLHRTRGPNGRAGTDPSKSRYYWPLGADRPVTWAMKDQGHCDDAEPGKSLLFH
jgi:hypothetical protein